MLLEIHFLFTCVFQYLWRCTHVFCSVNINGSGQMTSLTLNRVSMFQCQQGGSSWQRARKGHREGNDGASQWGRGDGAINCFYLYIEVVECLQILNHHHRVLSCRRSRMAVTTRKERKKRRRTKRRWMWRRVQMIPTPSRMKKVRGTVSVTCRGCWFPQGGAVQSLTDQFYTNPLASHKAEFLCIKGSIWHKKAYR